MKLERTPKTHIFKEMNAAVKYNVHYITSDICDRVMATFEWIMSAEWFSLFIRRNIWYYEH